MVWGFCLEGFITYPLFRLRMVGHYYRIREMVEEQIMVARGLVRLHEKDLESLAKIEEQLVGVKLGLISAKQKALELTRSRMEELVLARRKTRDRLYPESNGTNPPIPVESEDGREEDSG